MPSIYLKPEDYAAYGVTDATEQQVMQASAIIDGFIDRPHGLIYNDAKTLMLASNMPITLDTNSYYSGSVMLSYTPVAHIISVEFNNGLYGMPRWLSITNYDVQSDGQLYLGYGPNNAGIRIKYVGGYTYDTLPATVKQACASLVLIFQEGFFSGNIKELKAGRTGITWFDSNHGLIDASTQAMLAPFKRVFA